MGLFGRAYGTYSELIALPSSQAVTLPENTSFEISAFILIAFFIDHRKVFCMAINGKHLSCNFLC